MKAQQAKSGDKAGPEVQQLDFEFVLFASAVIDYYYIMSLIAHYTRTRTHCILILAVHVCGIGFVLQITGPRAAQPAGTRDVR
jgi:hypothetical protein